MKKTELIAKLKEYPNEAEVFFDDLHGGLINVEQCQLVSADEARRRGREIEKPAIILSDSSPLDGASELARK
jgi:hypothetical protein